MKESADNFYKRHGYTHKEVYKKIVYIKPPISASEAGRKAPLKYL